MRAEGLEGNDFEQNVKDQKQMDPCVVLISPVSQTLYIGSSKPGPNVESGSQPSHILGYVCIHY